MATTVEATPMTEPTPTPIASGSDLPISPAALKRVGVAVGAVAVLAVAAWVAVSSGKRKEAFAAEQLSKAREAADAGNLALASSELQKVITTYSGTSAANEATIALNQVRLTNNQSALAIDDLRKFVAAKPDAASLAAANGLLGAALENTGKPGDAATAYAAAAAAAPADFLKAEYQLGQARALRLSGKTDEAATVYRAIIEKLAATPSVTEAQVRLAELTKGKM